MMKRAQLLPLLVLALALPASLLLPGCGRGESGAPASRDKTGAAACDAYVARLEASAARAPAELRAAYDAAIRVARDRFEARADGAKADADRTALEDACKRMSDALASR